MNTSNKILPLLMGLSTTIAACAPINTKPAQPAPCPATSATQQISKTLKDQYRKLLNTDRILAQTIHDEKWKDKKIFWACADAHQECIARNSLRWNNFSQSDPELKKCKSLRTPIDSVAMPRTEQPEACIFSTIEAKGEYELIIDVLRDTRSCMEVTHRCMGMLESIKTNPAIDEAIKKADQDKSPAPDAVTRFMDPSIIDQLNIGRVLGSTIAQYVEKEVCNKNPIIVACEEKAANLSKDEKSAEAQQNHCNKLVATCMAKATTETVN